MGNPLRVAKTSPRGAIPQGAGQAHRFRSRRRQLLTVMTSMESSYMCQTHLGQSSSDQKMVWVTVCRGETQFARQTVADDEGDDEQAVKGSTSSSNSTCKTEHESKKADHSEKLELWASICSGQYLHPRGNSEPQRANSCFTKNMWDSFRWQLQYRVASERERWLDIPVDQRTWFSFHMATGKCHTVQNKCRKRWERSFGE